MICKHCHHFIGYGDWDLCCRLKHELCYDDTEACEKFTPRVEYEQLRIEFEEDSNE